MKKLFNLLSFVLLFAILIVPGSTLSQTGAGGVGSTATNPFWLDANELNLANNNPVSSFTDVSGNGNDFQQPLSANQPTFSTGVLNGLPVVSFDGVDDYFQRGATSGLETGAITVFIVYQKTTNQAQSLINAGYSGIIDKWMIYDPGNNRTVGKHSGGFAFFSDATGSPTFLSTHFRASGTQMYKQGTLSGTNSLAYSSATGNNLNRIGAYNYNLTAYFLQGYIAEIVVYNTELNTLERRIVENYLGAKYNMAIPTDRYAFEGTHNIGVIGIGNNGFNSHSDSKGSGVLQINTPSAMASGDHLFCGHSGEDLSSFTTADIPASIPTHKRWTRTWRADQTNNVGSVSVVFHLAGGNNFGASSSYRLLQDTDGNFSDATVSGAGTYNAGAQTITFTGINLADGDFFTLAGIEQMLEIHSIVDGPWSQTSTWDCTCIPTQNDEVYIDPSTNVTVDVNGETGYFSVEPGGTLTMSSNFTLSIAGEFDFAGTANLTDGTIAMVGTTDQYIDAGGGTLTFNNLTINNSGPADIEFFESEYILNGILSAISGNIILENNATEFIVNSTSATEGGMIGPVQSGATFSGLFTVRRNLPAGDADYRNIASPVVGAKFISWDPDLEISCYDCPDGCAYGSNGCFISIKHYKNGGYIDMGSINDVMDNALGYEVWVGDDLNTFSGTTLSQKGTLYTGSLVEPVSGNWEIKGNPYACPFDFDDLTFAGVGQYYYVYDVTIGTYQWYDRLAGMGSTAELDDGIVATGQGFWMNGPGTFTIDESDKETALTATFIRGQDNRPEHESLFLTLQENSSTYACVANIECSLDANDDLDAMDVKHLEMPDQKAPSIAFITSEDLVRRTYIERNLQDKALPVYIHILNDGYYTIETENIENFNDYSNVYIHDSETGDMVNLKDENQYVFYSEEGVFESRLTLILTNTEILEGDDAPGYTNIKEDNISITQMDHVIDVQLTDINLDNVEITLINTLGQVERVVEVTSLIEGSNLINIPVEVKGVRILRINDNGRIITKKLVF